MPGIDGYETCLRICANPKLKHAKIIMVSAKAMVSERLQGYDACADDYLTKPFEEDELLAKVRVYLRLQSIEEIDQLKSDLLSLVSHETRTPLNGIIGPRKVILVGSRRQCRGAQGDARTGQRERSAVTAAV